MGPEVIAVDEITAEADTRALLQAACCGVELMATAHAGSLEDFCRRRIYRPLREANLFQTILVLGQDQSFTVERMGL